VNLPLPPPAPEEDFLSEITRFLRSAEPVPELVLSAARTAYGWRSVVAAVADLEFDSAVDDDDLARVRMASAERRLRFRCRATTVEVSIIDAGRRLIGRLDPRCASSVVLRHPGRPEVLAEVDELGQFMFEGLPRGPMSIRTLPAGAELTGFQTEWVTI
jgi:hypothetical protein